jgi:hypothetical protein
MMTFSFDLISDLHVESWGNFDWTGQPTSPYCIVAGDVSRDRDLLVSTLTHLGESYAGVFYIDGNDEHRYSLDNLGESYKEINQLIKKIPNVIYMQDNVVIVNDVAILATNGWWTYDFDPLIDYDQTQQWYREYTQANQSVADSIAGMAYNDAAYLINSVKKLQTHKEVSKIILVSHTVPSPNLVNHDIELTGTYRFNCVGNPMLARALDEDTENKIKAWCFGHYHKSVDQVIHNVRYVSNPKGRGNTPWSQTVYYPKRIEI